MLGYKKVNEISLFYTPEAHDMGGYLCWCFDLNWTENWWRGRRNTGGRLLRSRVKLSWEKRIQRIVKSPKSPKRSVSFLVLMTLPSKNARHCSGIQSSDVLSLTILYKTNNKITKRMIMIIKHVSSNYDYNS